MTTNATRVADRHMRRTSRGYSIAALDAALKKLQRKFKRAKFKINISKTGSAIWDHRLQVGSKSLIYIRESGWSPNMQYETTVYGDGGWSSDNRINRQNSPPTERELWKLVTKVLNESPVLVARLRQKGITAPQAEALDEGLRTARTLVRGLISIPLEIMQQGDVEAGDVWFRMEYRDDATERDVTVFELVVDVSRKSYKAKSFGETLQFKTLRGALGVLNAADKLVKRGLRGLDAGDRNMLLGKITSESVVKRTISTETDFSRIDEWQDTIVRVTLMLRTTKKVPGKLLIQWAKDHWRDITPLIDDKTPAPASSHSRGMPYDEPAPGLGWQIPSRINPKDAEISFLGQDGNRAVVEVRQSHR